MTTRIIAVVIDTSVLTAYTPEGAAITVLQGDPRVQALLDAMPDIENQGFADVDLTYTNPYKEFESSLGGLVRFFRIARETVNTIFDAVEKLAPLVQEGPAVTPRTVGSVPKAPTITQQEAVDQIMAHAEPMGANENRLTEDETVIAVVNGNTAIPNTEKLEGHLAHSNKIGSTKGMEAFFARIAKTIHGREHSVEDLLRFMEKNDLPIADDGSLIVYKVLKDGPGKKNWVDCHTGKVPQRLGSRVEVDESLVDKNRRNECSNGLHVARRGYIGSFGGSVCTIAKVAPEDVITVPHGDPNKVRVCAYTLIGTLDNDAWQKLKNNVPMTDNPKAAAMLGRAVSGEHIGVTEIVHIGGQYGSNITVTEIYPSGKKIAHKVAPAVALDDKTMKELEPEVVQPETIANVIKDKATQAGANQSVRQLRAAELWEEANTSQSMAAAIELIKYKRQAKVTWDKLGIRPDQVERLMELSTQSEPVPTPEPEPELETLELTEDMQVEAPATPAAPSRALKAKELFNAKKFGELKAMKKAAKVSWGHLGFDEGEIAIINNN